MKDQRRPKSDKEDAQRPKEGIKNHKNAYILNSFFRHDIYVSVALVASSFKV